MLNNSSVEKVKLPPSTFIPNSGDMMTVAGWGKTEVSRIRFSTGLYSKKTGSMTLHYAIIMGPRALNFYAFYSQCNFY